MSYNGYTNYETWAIALWMDNDQGSQAYWLGEARHAANVNRLADQLQAEHEEALPDVTGFAADLLNAAMSAVNWREIAENLMEAAGDDATEEDAEDAETE